ncbi:hypothetical protein E2542_SST24890 [Spatholobus suberectus]|nr:hypothetical protein E2542_SST24890 [Spatholobus suberectus]
MLLGRVRRNFKHVMLVDVKSVVIFNDPLGRVRNRSLDSVFVYPSGKHGKNSKRTRSRHLVNSAILMGGARGIRRVSNAMLVAIVRAATQHRKKNSVSDSAILSQLVRNEFVLRNVDLIVSSESIPEASQNSAGLTSFSDYLLVQRGMGFRVSMMCNCHGAQLENSMFEPLSLQQLMEFIEELGRESEEAKKRVKDAKRRA